MDNPNLLFEQYLDTVPAEGKNHVIQLRTLLREIAPNASEIMKWGKPAFEQGTILFVYSAHHKHVTFVPTGPSLAPFLSELSSFILKKDSVQFSYQQPLPIELIRKIALHRVTAVLQHDAKWKY